MIQPLPAALLSLLLGATQCSPRHEPVATPTPPAPAKSAPIAPGPVMAPAKHEPTAEQSALAAAIAEAEALCDLGHGERCVRLGVAYIKPPVQDLARSAARFARGCQLGDATGCLEFGEALLAGRGVDVDRAQAVLKIEQACTMGLVGACAHAIRPPTTIEEVIETTEKACLRDDAAACMKVGELLLRREETGRALRSLKRACKAGIKRGCQAIAAIYELGIGTPVDEKRAVRLYRQYCKDGDLDSCCYLGQLAATGRMMPQDPLKAIAQWDTACDEGSMTCCLNAGIVLSTEELLPAEPARALKYLQRSCDGGEGQACAYLGTLLHQGFGGAAAGLQRVTAAFLRACELGQFSACERVLELRRSEAIRIDP